MKAAVWYGAKDIRIEQMTLRKIQDHEVKIKVAWAGICGSDLHEYVEGPILINTEKEDPLTKEKAPIILGHEFSGVVEEIGSEVTNFKVGDRVTVNPTLTKGLKDESIDRYEGRSYIGLNGHGGFAEYVIVPETHVYLLGENLTLQDGALVEPMAVSVQAVLDAGVKKGDSVAIFGAGPIGLLTLLASKAMGASEIYVVDILEKRLVKAKELGAHVINSVHMDPVEEIRKYCPDGVDCSFEIAGVPATFKQTIDATKVHGIVNIVAIHTKPVEWNPIQLTRSGVSIKASMVYSPSTFKKTIHAMNDGILQPRKIVTSITELEGIIEKGFEALINNKGEAKVLVEISGEN